MIFAVRLTDYEIYNKVGCNISNQMRILLEDYDPSRSPVSYDVMYLAFVYTSCDVWLGCPLTG